MKAIFLDLDGVLNSLEWNDNHEKEIGEGVLIDKKAVKLMSKLVHQTDAKVILHSGWKFWFDKNIVPRQKEARILLEMLEGEDIYIYDVTPDLTTEEIRQNKMFSLVKADEILAWLSKHNEVTNWVVIDDLDLHNEEIESHQVKTDALVGLTSKDIEKAMIIL